MFGAETGFKDKVIQEAKTLRETALLKKLLTSALNEKPDTADEPGSIATVKKTACTFVLLF